MDGANADLQCRRKSRRWKGHSRTGHKGDGVGLQSRLDGSMFWKYVASRVAYAVLLQKEPVIEALLLPLKL
jgi:hypothetical protein